MKNSRFLLFDFVKLVLAILVVNLHVESFITGSPFSLLYFLGWYAVPLFVTISFFFNAKYYLGNLSTSKLFSKLSRFLYPFFFWSILGFILHPELITLKYLFRQLLMGTAVDPPLYYLLIMSVFSIFFFIISKLKQSTRKYLLFTILLASLFWEEAGFKNAFTTSLPIQIEFFTSRLLELVKYGALGILLSLGMPLLNKSRKYLPTILLLTAIMVLGYSYYQWSQQLSGLTYSGFIQFLAVLLFIVSLILLQDISLPKFIKNISSLGKYTLGIYCLHTFFIEMISSIPNLDWGVLSDHNILTLLIVILSVLVSVILSKVNLKRVVE